MKYKAMMYIHNYIEHWLDSKVTTSCCLVLQIVVMRICTVNDAKKALILHGIDNVVNH